MRGILGAAGRQAGAGGRCDCRLASEPGPRPDDAPRGSTIFNSLLNSVSGSPWTYALIVGVCAGDALLPLFPAETVVITAAVLAANGKLNIGLVAAAAAVGAILGDNSAYWLGRSGLRRLSDRLLGSESNQRRLRWAQAQIEQNGAWIIIVARFIPGGRTATTYIAGTLEMPWSREFLLADTFAAVVWALFGSGLGYLGGSTFEKNLWLPILIATGASLVIAGAGELVRRTFFAAGGEDADESSETSEGNEGNEANEGNEGNEGNGDATGGGR